MYKFLYFFKFEFSGFISSNILSVPFSLTFKNAHYVYVGTLVDAPQDSEALFIFLLSFLFLFPRLYNFNWPIFKFSSLDCIISIDQSSSSLIYACSNLPLNLSSEFFISVTVLLSCRISLYVYTQTHGVHTHFLSFYYSLFGETSSSYFPLILYT